MRIIHPVFQVILAIVFVMVLLMLAFGQFNKEKLSALRDAGKLRKKVAIFEGVVDLNSRKDEKYNTVDKNSRSFRDLSSSVNQSSGVEYSYNFWMYFDQAALTDSNIGSGSTSALGNYKTADSSLLTPDQGLKTDFTLPGNRHKAPVVLFMRGDPRTRYYKRVCNPSTSPDTKLDVMVKNPMVTLEHGGDVLSISFNTVDAPDAHKGCGTETGSWDAANSQKIGIKGIMSKDDLNKKWFMVTIVIQETDLSLALSSRNHTKCIIYINGQKKSSQTVSGLVVGAPSPVRQATGPLVVNPTLKDPDNSRVSLDLGVAGALKIADLTYGNYAFSEGEVKMMYTSQFSRQTALTPDVEEEYDYSSPDASKDISPQFKYTLPEISS